MNNTPLSALKGVGKTRLCVLEKANLLTLQDLLYRFPISYKDTTKVTPIASLRLGECACIKGEISNVRLNRYPSTTCVYASVSDNSGSILVQYFNQPWMRESLLLKKQCMFYGRVQQFKGNLVLASPSIETKRGIQPIYKTLKGMSTNLISQLIDQALTVMEGEESASLDWLPSTLKEKYALLPLSTALQQIHHPSDLPSLQAGLRRTNFDQLLLYQALTFLLRGKNAQGVALSSVSLAPFYALFSFPFTGAQKRVIGEILSDMQSGLSMNRLVQGDVGSGKTAVAFAGMYATVQNGYQAVLMAPTEILARQHFDQAEKLFGALGIRCGLLLGAMKAKEKREAHQSIKDGTWQVVIGTHALLSEQVEYHNVALIITDEQHRFGVAQRKKLETKAEQSPHTLVMSATPIPRSLALVLYGDLDVSIIDEMPPGRTPVKTFIVPEERREGMYRFLLDQVKQGRQVYIVCPLVEESETMEAKSVQDVYATLSQGALRTVRVGITYGEQEYKKKSQTLEAFVKGEIDVLIATTVIEVGVNVPNATVMIIEDAKLFGLATLHQLRGRVGRGSAESFCFLMSEKNKRLQTLCNSNDGFEIANMDLSLRGPGDVLGTRQHGEMLLDMCADEHLLSQTKEAFAFAKQPNHQEMMGIILQKTEETFLRKLQMIAFN